MAEDRSTKTAYADISLQFLSDLIFNYRNKLLKAIEASPLGDQFVRLRLAGDELPDTCSDQPHPVKLWYERTYDEALPHATTTVVIIDATADRIAGSRSLLSQ